MSLSAPPSFKTLVIRPGETAVIKKNINVIRTINDGDVTMTSSCPDMEDTLNATSETLVQYALMVEVVDELINRGAEDFITAAGLGNDLYPFASPISLNAFKDDFTNPGAVQLFNAIQQAIPSGTVLLRSPEYQYENWAGPSGDTSRDNFYRGLVKFKSFPSIVETLGLFIQYENTPTFGSNTTKYIMRIYPSRTTS